MDRGGSSHHRWIGLIGHNPMHHPDRAHNIALAVMASGILVGIIHGQLPHELVHDRLLGVILILYWPNAVLFGGGSALFSHFKARAQDALARGEDVIARWHVDAATWRAFIAHNDLLNQESDARINELSIRDEVPANGIDVIVGREVVQVDGSIHMLPRRGTPQVTHAGLNASRVRPSFIELQLYYPGGGYGASGVPRSSLRTALRFPVAASAHRAAEQVVKYYVSGRPGEADFFHGPGDGTHPEDVSTCYLCGHATHQFLSHCPRCGATMQSKRWSRRFGGILFACGLFITGLIGAVIFYTLPLMLQPGASVGGTRFSGTASQTVFVLGIFGIVLVFGVSAMLYGLWQMKTGRRSKKVIYFIIGLASLLLLAGLATALL